MGVQPKIRRGKKLIAMCVEFTKSQRKEIHRDFFKAARLNLPPRTLTFNHMMQIVIRQYKDKLL